jgi:hypothetical protein
MSIFITGLIVVIYFFIMNDGISHVKIYKSIESYKSDKSDKSDKYQLPIDELYQPISDEEKYEPYDLEHETIENRHIDMTDKLSRGMKMEMMAKIRQVPVDKFIPS